MNKKEVFKKVMQELQATLEVLIKAAHEARDAATNEESKAENKYDTRGLEASYLAGAQAKRATELQDNIKKLSQLKLRSFEKNSPADITALVKVEVDGENSKWLFLLPFAGGVKVNHEDQEIQSLSPQTPLGQKLKGTEVGDYIDLKIGNKHSEYQVVEIL